ncbi:hypothetical protein [Thiomicrospira sp. WB1]|uniref:hypothetical protein n=1 Tax=Thiomicrospira sp. WB1 TaxID=1685380 RepID=UPI000749F3A9|nr:hypothetical protein [Thiomicrospira sp. WB1]KUJ72460.1 hypothetical protein AVO41_01215 [Thiomicrospira sp. WB1]
MLNTVLLTLFGFILCFVSSHSQASNCHTTLQTLEKRLLQEPSNTYLRQAYALTLTQCRGGQKQEASNAQGKLEQSISVEIGHETNPTRTSYIEQFQLTLPQGVLTVDNNAPTMSSDFLKSEYSLQYQRNRHQWQVDAFIQDFKHPHVNTTKHLNMRYRYAITDKILLSVDGQTHHYHANHYNQGELGVIFAVSPDLLTQASFARRLYPDSNHFDSNMVNVSAFGRVSGTSWQYGLGATLDKGAPTRTGGDQKRLFGYLNHDVQIDTFALSSSVFWQEQRDEEPYSFLLKNGKARHLQTFGLQLQLELAEYESLSPYVQLGHWRQRSNLAIFKWKSNRLNLGLKANW